MPDTYTTEQVMLLSGHSRREIYTLANRFGWSVDIPKPNYRLKLYDAGKVTQYLQAKAITAQAQKILGYGKHGRLLWPVTTCPTCQRSASYIRTSIFCINGHYTER